MRELSFESTKYDVLPHQGTSSGRKLPTAQTGCPAISTTMHFIIWASLSFHRRFLVSIPVIIFYGQLVIITCVNSATWNLQTSTSRFKYRNRWTGLRQSKLRSRESGFGFPGFSSFRAFLLPCLRIIDVNRFLASSILVCHASLISSCQATLSCLLLQTSSHLVSLRSCTCNPSTNLTAVNT